MCISSMVILAPPFIVCSVPHEVRIRNVINMFLIYLLLYVMILQFHMESHPKADSRIDSKVGSEFLFGVASRTDP